MEVWFRPAIHNGGIIFSLVDTTNSNCNNVVFNLLQDFNGKTEFEVTALRSDMNIVVCNVGSTSYHTSPIIYPLGSDGEISHTILSYDPVIGAKILNENPSFYELAVGGSFLQSFPIILPSLQNIDLVLAPNAKWRGEIFKISFYNEALTQEEYNTLATCSLTNTPFVPNIIQHVYEDTTATLILNGQKKPALSASTKDFAAANYDSSLQTRPTLVSTYELAGEELYDIGARIYNLQDYMSGASEANYTFQILDLPKSFKFSHDGIQVNKNDEYSNKRSLSLKYQALPNEHSWEYDLIQSEWITNLKYTSFSYRVKDQAGGTWSNTGIFTVVVDPMPDPPELTTRDVEVRPGQNVILKLSVPQIDEKIVSLSNRNVVDQQNVDTAIVSKLPETGDLQYCTRTGQECEDCSNWENCTQNVPTKTEYGNGQYAMPCLRYFAKVTNLANRHLMYTDNFNIQMKYSQQTPLFSDAGRTGNVSPVAMKVINPLVASGNAPFINEVCQIDEDIESSFNLSYTSSTPLSAAPIFKIKPLPSNFLGTLTIEKKSEGEKYSYRAGDNVLKEVGPEDTIFYTSLKDQYTVFPPGENQPGLNFNYTVQGNIGGVNIDSLEGTQNLCINPKNDLLVIDQIRFLPPSKCCEPAQTCREPINNNGDWGRRYAGDRKGNYTIKIPNQENSFENIKEWIGGDDFPDKKTVPSVSVEDCVTLNVDWHDVDDPESEYKVKIVARTRIINDKLYPTAFTLSLPPSFRNDADGYELLSGKGIQTETLIFQGKYHIIKKILQSPDLKLNIGLAGTQELEITIEDISNEFNTDVGRDEIVVKDIILESLGSGSTKFHQKEDDTVFGLPFTATQFRAIIIATLVLFCFCYCAVLIWCYKRDPHANKNKNKGDVGLNSFQFPSATENYQDPGSGKPRSRCCPCLNSTRNQ